MLESYENDAFVAATAQFGSNIGLKPETGVLLYELGPGVYLYSFGDARGDTIGNWKRPLELYP